MTGDPNCDVHGYAPCGCTLEERAARAAEAEARAARFVAAQEAEVTRLVTVAQREEERRRGEMERITDEAHAEAEAIAKKLADWIRHRAESGCRTTGVLVGLVFENGETGILWPLRGLSNTALVGATERALRRLHEQIDEVDALADEILPPTPDEVPPEDPVS